MSSNSWNSSPLVALETNDIVAGSPATEEAEKLFAPFGSVPEDTLYVNSTRLLLAKFLPNVPFPNTTLYVPLVEGSTKNTLLVAVMLSAQTTDKKVNQVTPTLFKYANTPEKMAALKVNIIQDVIREIGLAPTKAKNLKKMAEQLS